MKNFILLALSLVFLSGCSTLDFSTKDIYAGTFIRYNYNSLNDQTDTLAMDIRIQFDDSKFVVLDESGNEGCNGTFNLKGIKKLEFESEECSCWCDCNPNIDCAGDQLLGSYDITADDNGQLKFERNWTYETVSGNELSTDFFFDLKKE